MLRHLEREGLALEVIPGSILPIVQSDPIRRLKGTAVRMKSLNDDDRRAAAYVGVAFAVLIGGLALSAGLLRGGGSGLVWAAAVLAVLPGATFALYHPVSRCRHRWIRVAGLVLLSGAVLGYAGLNAVVGASAVLLPAVLFGAFGLTIAAGVALLDQPRSNSVTCAAAPLREVLAGAVRSRASITQEHDRFTLLMAGRSFVGEGDTVDVALADLARSLRDHAAGWETSLDNAPGRHGDWAFVQLINLSSDDQLREWLAVGPRRHGDVHRAER